MTGKKIIKYLNLKIFLAIIVLVFVVIFVRARVIKYELKTVESSESRIRCAILEDKDLEQHVACQTIGISSVDDIWSKATNYEEMSKKFDNIFFNFDMEQLSQNNNKTKLKIIIGFWLMTEEIELEITNSDTNGIKVSEWSETGSGIISKGFWKFEPLDNGKTRIYYHLNFEYPFIPKFITDVILLDHLRWILKPLQK